MAVKLVILPAGKSHRRPGHHLTVVGTRVKNPYPVQIRNTHPQVFILAELLQPATPERKDKPGIGQKRRHPRKRLLLYQMPAQKIIQLVKTFVIAGKTGVHQHLTVAELHSRQRLDPP